MWCRSQLPRLLFHLPPLTEAGGGGGKGGGKEEGVRLAEEGGESTREEILR